ncbi:MAG: hypothetical protein C4526_09215 [Nitrospiraceae bacterium]|nr:MAG: hypothetical protein C4526_09215 [Nitrospiraceae bacterium]
MFDRNKLKIKPLEERVHDLDMGIFKPLVKSGPVSGSIRKVARRIITARENGKEVIFMMGGHVIRSGTQKYIIDLLEKGYLTCISMNGSGIIHDYEFSLIGATTESVARYICEGQFGLWEETARINDIINSAYTQGTGMGLAVGAAIQEGNFPFKDISIAAACSRLKIPLTVHIGIGYDIIHEHPNFDAAAAGATSYIDFLKLADIVSNLDGGVVMNFGSAVMAPEVYLKALSMARNLAHQNGKAIRKFTTLVCDLLDLPEDFSKEPPRESSAYYFRPWKTMLVRTVADGGESFYVRGKHADTIPELWTAVTGKN